MTPQRITLITLGVADIERAAAYYAALGWQPHPRSSPDMVFYQLKGLVLGLFPREALAADQDRPGASLGTGAITLAQNMPTRDDVDALFAQAVAAGATPLKPPQDVFWGGYSSYVSDPDGHVWEIAHNPFWPLADDGSLTLPDADT